MANFHYFVFLYKITDAIKYPHRKKKKLYKRKIAQIETLSTILKEGKKLVVIQRHERASINTQLQKKEMPAHVRFSEGLAATL